jgi:hypothetical protein
MRPRNAGYFALSGTLAYFLQITINLISQWLVTFNDRYGQIAHGNT